MDELVQVIRKLKESEDVLRALAQDMSGHVQGVISEASEDIRRAQVRLHSLVARDRRREQRQGGSVPGGD